MSDSLTPDLLHSTAETSTTSATKGRRSMRKSCHFCRSRKIKCSGETICDACRERNLECSYNEGEPKGRPKLKSRLSVSSNSSKRNPEQQPDAYDPLGTLSSIAFDETLRVDQNGFVAQPYPSSSSEGSLHSKALWQEDDSVAAQLSSAFSWLDGGSQSISAKPSNALDKRLAMINDHLARHGEQIVESSSTASSTMSMMSYEDLFHTISHELIEMLARRLGEIGCSQLGYGRSHYFIQSFVKETNPTLFEISIDSNDLIAGCNNTTREGSSNPLHNFDSHQLPQMLEIWFSQHPFSFMFSKTLLLRDVRQEKYDDILMATILGDVESASRIPLSRSRSKALYEWAFFRLGNTDRSEVRLTTIQAIVLLGWHALCTGHARRALTFFAWADANIGQIRVLDTGINVVNGIDIGEVEAESLRNTHWLLYSLFLWIIMQTQMASRDFLPWEPPACLPIADASELAILRLDQASGSFSTLQSQEGAYHELWLLSYITAFVSQIYVICPRIIPINTEASTTNKGWSSEVLTRLRGLSDPMDDILWICTQVRHLLQDLLRTSMAVGKESDSRALELSVVHTILIHLLLPSSSSVANNAACNQSETGVLGGRRVIAAGGIHKLLDDFHTSARALYQMATSLQGSPSSHLGSSRITMSQKSSTKGSIVSLALDACVRGLYSIWSLSRFGTDAERQHLASRQAELRSLASDLHVFSRNIQSSNTSGLGPVIEKLEIVICYLDGVEFEDYSDTQPSSSYTSTNASTRSRTPPHETFDLMLHTMPPPCNAIDPPKMDFFGLDSTNGYYTFPSQSGMSEWVDMNM